MKNSKIKTSIFLAFLLLSTSLLYAIPAIPDPVVMTQPNGDTLTVMIRGDERINWYESMDGYTLLFNKAGYLSYAQLDESGNLQPSGIIATDIEIRDITITSFLNTIDKNLFYSDLQIQLLLKIWEIEEDAHYQQSLKTKNGIIGNYKIICALVQFPEKEMVKSIQEFDDLFNQLGYTGNGNGSVRDYFKEVSYDLLNLTITICGVYTAPQSQTSYAGTGGHDNVRPLARWLAQQVEKELDFSEYDTNASGMVDGFHFIFAGRGREAGGGPETIWSHKSSLSSPVYQNGIRIELYSCSPELYYNNITTIGVICHEMTHVFSAADFYDTNGVTGGSFTGTGNWDLMAGGSWNSSGNRPAHPNMYIKIQFGWVKPVILSSPTSIIDMPNSVENPVAYRINTSTYNEYYLLENRQRIKFDTNVPGSGLLIYHVHSNVGSCINCTHPQRMYPVCASRNTQMPGQDPSTYGSINSARCVFPLAETSSAPAKTEFTDDSTPAMRSWAGRNSEKPITNIIHENRLISFDFMKLGIDDAIETNSGLLKIIPNPANEYIDVQFSMADFKFGNIDFYNVAGQLVMSTPFLGEYSEGIVSQRVSITDLSKGVYIVKVSNETAKIAVY